MSFKIIQAVCDRLGGEMPVVRDEQVISKKLILINLHVGLIICDFMASRRFPKPILRWWPPWATSPPSLQRLAMWEMTRCDGIRQILFFVIGEFLFSLFSQVKFSLGQRRSEEDGVWQDPYTSERKQSWHCSKCTLERCKTEKSFPAIILEWCFKPAFHAPQL